MLSAIVGLSLLMGQSPSFDHYAYPVQNLRPSKLLKRLMPEGAPGLIPVGLAMKANRLSGELLIEGSAQSIEEIKRVIEMFDVRPQHIRLAMSVVAPIDKYRSDWQGSVANNTPTTILDGEIGLSIRLAPRINSDGTITLTTEFISDGRRQQTVARIKNGDSMEFVLHESGMKVDVPKGSTLLTFERMTAGQAAVHLTAQIAE
jgi:type II secretory pathway component GspD/PulD (secretin)